MRKTAFVRALRASAPLICLAAFVPLSTPSFAQESTPAASAKVPPAATLPSGPKELMQLAAKSNGLAGDDVKPWHLKATYKSLDEQGNIKDQGTYEEFWIGPKKFKRSITGAALTLTEYGTENGILVTGPQNPPSNPMLQLRHEFVGAVLDEQSIQRFSFGLYQRDIGKTRLNCLRRQTPDEIRFGTSWCLDAGKPMLRIIFSPPDVQVVHNTIQKFQERFIPGDLVFARDAKTVLTAHIENLEFFAPIDESIVQPPPDATPKNYDNLPAFLSAGVAVGRLMVKTQPAYPLYALEQRISGTVVLQARIGKDGRIKDLRFVQGPPELKDAAMDAVKQWIYQPYVLYDEPVEVETTVNVIFTLGARP
jgi:TonB family protein